MYFQQSGQGEKTVVFLHGWGCDGSIFEPIAKRLADYKVYLVDFPGFGKTPPPQSAYTVADYANELRDFLAEQGLNHVTLVGHSFGCRVAMVLSASYPQLVDRMLLVAPAGIRRFSLKRWWSVHVYKLRKFFAKLSGKPLENKYGSEDYRNCCPIMKATFIKVVNEDLSRYAKRIVCPVLIVNGRTDTATPLKNARRLHRLISDSQLVEIDGDHFAFFYSPTAFANTVKNFVR